MSSITTKAIIAQIDFGFTQIEGLMLPDGSYGIAVAQANTLLEFSGRNKDATRALKPILGKDFEGRKVKTELNSNAIYVLTIGQFSDLIFELATKHNNSVAIALLKASMQETIERRFDIAFNQRVEESERNERLALRMQRLLTRKTWTDVLQDRHLELYGTKPVPNQFKSMDGKS
jgi:hypothetical protein